MNPLECVQVVAYIALRCPAQRIEDGTPDAWFDDLRDVTFDDARAAARRVSAAKPFVALSDLLAEAESLRQKRFAMAYIDTHPALTGPQGRDFDVNERGIARLRQAWADAQTAAKVKRNA